MDKKLILIFIFILAFFILFFLGHKYFFALEEKVSFAILTDIAYCTPSDGTVEKYLDTFLEETRVRKVDTQISLGDNAKHRLRSCSITGDQDARRMAEKIRSNGIPSYFVLGDHDIESSVQSYQAWLETNGREKTYYSFDVKNVHVVVLDTVLGGDPMSPPCEEIESCRKAQEVLNSSALAKGSTEHQQAKDVLQREEERLKETRSSGRRNEGRLGEEQLKWLEADLKNTKKKKLVVVSDHPLFPFVAPGKSYNAVNTERVREIVKKSEKEAVFISGEAHMWHEEVFEGYQFYIVDKFDRLNGSWALFEWDKSGFRLDRITH